MKITQHGKYLWKLTRFWFVNSFFIAEEDGLTLIDTNLPGSASGIIRAAETLGQPIKRMALTHAHGDHAGSLDELSDRLTGIEIAFTQRTANFLQGNLSLEPEEPQTKLRGSFYPRNTPVGRVLQPGDMFGSLRVIAAPGHSPDQIAFLDERDETLIAGDAFQTQGRTAVSGVIQWRFPFPGIATWNLPTALESARSLQQLQPKWLAVGHGPVLEDPMSAMDDAIRVAEAKLDG